MKLMKMLFWEMVFVMFILPWAWFPIALGLWEEEGEPEFVTWVIDRAIGRR